MVKYNAENERIKRLYFEWEKEANGKSLSTVDNMRNAIYLFEEFTKFKSFKLFNKNDAVSFKKHIAQKLNQRTQEPISKTYLLHTANNLMNLFKWLQAQKGYKKKINLADIAYFSLSEKDMQTAQSVVTKKVPTLNQIEHVIKNMPIATEVQRRDRALVVFLILTGIRISAAASIKLKHIDIEQAYVEQNPNEVKTKFGKKILTYFLPINDYFKDILAEWINYLKNEKLFDYDAPLFPKTILELDENKQFIRETLDVAPWQSTNSIRKIIKKAFQAANLPYYNPHSFRDTLVRHYSKICKTPQDFKAFSQNLGHNSPLTTFTSYGHIDEYNQGEIIKRLGKGNEEKLADKNN